MEVFILASTVVKHDVNKVMDEIQAGVESFEKSFPLEEFAKGDYKQYPSITLLSCADSRMPSTMFGPLFNRVFAIENIGNQVKSNEGSILYGLLHLRTPIMIIAGHTDCGALKAAESNFLGELFALRNELSIVKNSLDDAKNLFTLESADDPAVFYSQLAELNVDMQVEYLLSIPQVATLVEDGDLSIIGVSVDLHKHYGEAYGKIYTINVNGENDANILKTYSDLGWFAERAKRLT